MTKSTKKSKEAEMMKEPRIIDTNNPKYYDSWAKLHGVKANDKKAEKCFEVMSKVRNAYERSKSYLETSCYWDAYQEDSTGVVFSGGSWYDRRTLQEKMALMWYRKPSSDDFVSNIKSPMSRGRINTFVNWMKRTNLEFGAKPNNKDDRNAAFTAERTINYWMRGSNAKLALFDAYEDLGTYGNAFLKLSYVEEYRDYQFPKTKADKLSEEETEKVDKKEVNIIYDEPETYCVTDDVVLEHVPIREIFPDPQARNLHGDSYRAGWIIRKRFVTMSYLKAVFGNHPNCKNIDMVKGSTSYRDLTEYFFDPPRDTMASDIVELLEMEDQDCDRYYVVANDIVIIGAEDEVPLPQSHKEISYHKLDFLRVPGQFFSIGICDLLDNIQSSYEVALNMVADYIYRTYNYKLLVESDNYGEIQQSFARTSDMIVPLDTSDGRALSQKIMPLPVSPISFDIFSFLDLLERQATLATNIDPAQMAMLAGSKTATSDILNKELLMTMIGGVIENNTNGDLRSIGRQLWKLQQQFYTKKRVQKITGDKKEEVPRTIRFEGVEISFDKDTDLLFEKEVDVDYTFFELKDEYLSTKDELDIFIKPDSKEVESQALDEQKIAEEFAQLMPFAVDPNNAQQIAMHAMPMVDANKLFMEYFQVKRLPENLLLNRNTNANQTVKKAEDDVTQILQGKNVESVPGQSSGYLEYCYKVLDGLVFGRDEKLKDLEDDLNTKAKQVSQQFANMPPFDPMTGQPIQLPQPEPDPALVKQVEKFDKVIQELQMHLTISSMPAAMRNSRVLSMQQQSAPSPTVPPSQGQGMGVMEAPMPPGGANPIDPGMVNAANPAGQVPMAAPMPGMGGGVPNPLAQ